MAIKTAKGKKSRRIAEAANGPMSGDEGLSDLGVARMVFGAMATNRTALASQLGESFEGKRDLYKECGYPLTLEWGDYWNKYDRLPVGGRVVEAYPDACWKTAPEVKENHQTRTTKFETAFVELAQRTKLFHYLQRVDTLAGIGRYAVLLIGYDDGGSLGKPVEEASDVIFLQPYGEDQVSIAQKDMDHKSARFGMPELYRVALGHDTGSVSGETSEGQAKIVHHSRILHVADGVLKSDVIGKSRLHTPWNNLHNIEQIMGASAEMFWKGGFPGYNFALDPEADVLQSKSDMEDQIENYVHGLTRMMRLQGVEVQQLVPQVSDPETHLAWNVRMVSAYSKIPQRVLLGSEQAQLASGQDRRNWQDRVLERQKNWCEPQVLLNLIDKWVEYKILPTPKRVIVQWASLPTEDPKDLAEVAAKKTRALAEYAGSGASLVMEPELYFREVWGMTPALAREVSKDVDVAEIIENGKNVGGATNGAPATGTVRGEERPEEPEKPKEQ